VESGNRDEGNVGGVITDLLQEISKFILDFVVSILGVLDSILLIQTDNHLFDTQSEGQQGVFSGLSIFGNTSFEFTSGGGNHENGTIGLGSTSNHVLDEISMSGGINDGEDILTGFELPESDIDGDTSFSFGFELVQDPGVFERSLTHFGGFLLELFDSSFINTSALEDQVSSGGGFSGVDVTNNDEGAMSFVFRSH
jgi:hypothetical protein